MRVRRIVGVVPVLLAGLLLGPASAAADPQPGQPAAGPPPAGQPPAGQGAAEHAPIAVRTGGHGDFGRVVFDLPAGATWRTGRDGDTLTVRFSGGGGIAPTAATTRNVHAIAPVPGGAVLTLAAGAHARAWRLGSRLVVDVFDPAGHAATPAAAPSAVAATMPHRPAPARQPVAPKAAPVAAAKPPAAGPGDAAIAAAARARAIAAVNALADTPPPPTPLAPKLPAPTPLAPTPPTMTPAPLTPVQATAPTPTAGTLALAAQAAAPHAVTLPFAAGTGAAAFRRGEGAVVVFDEQRPVDLAPLRGDPVFGAATIALLPAATLLRLPLGPGEAVRLSRVPAGWTVAVLAAGGRAPTPIRPEFDAGRLRLPAAAPGLVISVPDPLTGGTLLVGTQKSPGQGVPVDRRAPEFVLLPTWQGVAVAPASDALTLRPAREGFVLSADAQRTLALSVPNAAALAAADAHALSRRFDFPDLPVAGLLRRAQAAIATAAATPPQARGPKRLEVGQALLALGMGAEAQAVLRLAATDDGRMVDDPDQIGLSAIAAMLAGRPAESDGIEDPRLDGTDEVALWRAVRTAQHEEGSPAAAPVFAATINLLLSYPKPLRDHLLPLAAETMALGGERKAAARLLAARKDDPSLLLAAGLLAEANGDTKAALAVYDRAAQSGDRLVRARAAFRAVQLRVADGALAPAKAADALDRQIYAWRGDGRELKVRLRTAELRADGGDPRRALALLRETARVYPADAPAIHARLEQTFAAALAHEAKNPLPPLELVALAEENADLIPAGEAGRALAGHLADRLVALDLPGRALPVLQKLADATPPGDARSELGAKLASVRLRQGDAAGALASLAATLGVGRMKPALLERRTLIYARAAAAAGQLPQAVQALTALDTAPGDELRATLLEQARQWPGAEAALLAWTARVVPSEGMLTAVQATALLRLASAAAQAGDEAMLARLFSHDLPRIPPGNLADMFRLITAGPVQAVSDLGRAEQETKLASRIPDALKSLTSEVNPVGPAR
ncbi:MAG: hypothetical protein BGP12_05285 [Rhodospirillales bacterium 70-18]|nr:hypothetical protein [Rhodospirillales bacterium]OJY76863.1 MAG: hypothetical protein BGP12_05285 [Rhodospirillales bacterium 70-18]